MGAMVILTLPCRQKKGDLGNISIKQQFAYREEVEMDGCVNKMCPKETAIQFLFSTASQCV